MKFRNWIFCTGLLCGVGCSATPDGGDALTNTGGTGTAQGGSAPVTGGMSSGGTTTGGTAPATGGFSTGGTLSTGGSSVTGGSATGGNGTGGGFFTGGSSTGGSNTGGSGAGGSSTTGGKFGGKSTGGNSNNTGGSNFGGNSNNTGGSNTGGGGGSSTGGSGGSMDPVQLYGAVCAMCHGERGEGVSGKGPEIQHPVRDFATWVVRNGRSGNPGYPNQTMAAFNQAALPDATLTAMFDWLSTPALPKPTTGAALYKDYCANCHGATGTGGTAGHNAKGEPLSKALQMVRSGHNVTQFSSRTGYMSKWSTTELTDAEVGLIVTYLNSL